MDQYRLVFSLMWRLKRVEHSLNQSWLALRELTRELTFIARGASASRRFSSRQQSADVAAQMAESQGGKEWKGDDVAVPDWSAEERLSRLVKRGLLERRKMERFLQILQSYFSLEVIEGGWLKFLEAAKVRRGSELTAGLVLSSLKVFNCPPPFRFQRV